MILIGFFVWHILLSNLISLKQEENIQRHLLISEKMLDIAQYEKRQQKIVNSRIRLNFITNLRHQNGEAGQVLKELNKAMPNTIVLTRVQWQSRMLFIDGYTHSDVALIAWIDDISHSPLLMRPVITSMDERNPSRYFQLRIGLKR